MGGEVKKAFADEKSLQVKNNLANENYIRMVFFTILYILQSKKRFCRVKKRFCRLKIILQIRLIFADEKNISMVKYIMLG